MRPVELFLRNDIIVAKIESGMKASEIAREYRISRQRVCQIYQRKGLRPRKIQRELRVKKLHEMAGQGCTLQEMATALGLTYATVCHTVSVLRIPHKRVTYHPPKIDRESVRVLWLQGMVFREITAALGISMMSVARICRELGLRRMPRRK